VGVPAGGSTGQVLQKLSATSYDTGWLTLGTMSAATASDYSTTTVANGLYYPLSGNPSGFITASALTPYLEKAGGIITGNILSNNGSSFSSYDNVYKTATLNSASVQLNNAGPGGYALTMEWDGITFQSGKQTVHYPGAATLFTSPVLTGDPTAPTPATSDNDTSIATTAFVKAQGYLTSAPVTSVAGRTGAITLSNADISGLGSLAVVNDAPSDGSQYARKNGAWDVVSAGAAFISSVSSPLAVATGNLTVDLSAYLTSATAASTYQTLAGMSSYLTTATAASTYYLQTNPSGFQTAADVTTALSPYLLSATAASTYAVIAAGQPVAGSTGQVLTKNSGTNYDSSWATPVVGDRYLTTSTTSNTVSNGNKTFTIGTGLSYTPTQNITISYDASNHMHGEVLTYNSGTGVLTVDVNHHTGSGTYASWVVNVGGVTPATSVAWGAITGTLSAQTDLQSALDLKLAATTAATTYYPLSGNPSAFLVAADITGKANIASPSLTGTPLSTTAAVDTNTTQIATTAFVVGQAGSATPLVDGTAAVGTSLRYARQDHVHGTDTTRLATANNLSELSATASTARTNLGLGTAAVEPATKLVPAGGTTGQALVKLSNSDWDDGWATITGPTLSANQTWTGVNEFSNGSGTFGDSTSGGTINISNGLISTGSQSVNICQNGQLGSTTTINIGTTNQNGLCTINTAGALVLSPGGGGNTAAPLRFSSLSTPTTFTDGDVWMTGSGLSLRLSGVSQQVALLGTVQTFTGNKTFSGSSTFTGLVSTRASTAVDGAGFRIVPGIAPTTAVAGDVWINTGVLGTISFRNSTTVQTCAVLGLANQNFTASGIQFSGATVSLGTSTAASTTNVASGATLAATTKTVNIGTNGVATSVTNINVGSATSTTTINLNGTVNAAGLSNGVKAWVNFNGIGTVAIRASYNVSSITDNGVGDYTVNFTTALADVNYAVSSTSNRIAATTQFVGMSEGTRAVGSIQVFSNYGASGVLDTDFINVTIIR
jgi:hypothetical protein